MESRRLPLSRRASIALLVLLLASSVATGCRRTGGTSTQEAAPEDEVVPVSARAVQTGAFRMTLHASGVVVPADGAEFLAVAPEPARVVEVTRQAGEMVAAGDLLVRFDLPAAAQEASRQQAEVNRLQAQVENARVAQSRMRDLVTRGLVPRVDQDAADRELADAQAALMVAQNAQARATAAAARTIVRAPFSGLVANRLHNPGDLAQPSSTDPVLRIVDPARLEVMALVPGVDASHVLPGASARVAGFIDGRTIPLRVVDRPSGIPDAEGRLRIRLSVLEAASLMVDQPIEIDIDGEERRNIAFVTPDALVGGRGAAGSDQAVFVVRDGVARRRAVKTGASTELGVEILEGLRPGELVVTRGQGSVSDGSAVSAQIEP